MHTFFNTFLQYTYSCPPPTPSPLPVQPLFVFVCTRFPNDSQALDVDKQFMLGPALLVSPVLTQGASNVTAYFPEGQWYDYLTGEAATPGTVTLDTPLDKFNLHIRAGHVIPWQEPDVTTVKSRQKNLGLLVALGPSGRASGSLYWDDGESGVSENPPNFNLIKFDISRAGELTIRPEVVGLNTTLVFDTVELYGLRRLPTRVTVNGVEVPAERTSIVNTNIFKWTGLNLPMTSEATIRWTAY
ncbi:hypothetical protein EGW08_007443 [Elysia chlorotica]|uniref:Glycosyl hydrolase family 31 C-terminal domain-containing protein n=1 Tax=Elysia chlorotica TaxID=188477 RepID=A0A433TTF7_ELYCH|nr:hypothetical protein EGW08_007443 [Elysia chlorotica]